jgi:RimJ/RimL family protein N-acetyltransferase
MSALPGAGLASLLAACLAHGRALGLRIVRLAVITTNIGTILLSLRHGFSVYGVERAALFVDGVYHDELLMACSLRE